MTETRSAAPTQSAYQDDAPDHPLLTRHTVAPLIETRVSKTIAKPMAEVFQHFWGSEPRLRLELHKDHVKSYNIHRETPTTLEYEFTFEAYGTRNWGKAVEVAHRPNRIDVEVIEGPIAGQTVTTLFREVPGGTEVTQVNRVWPGPNEMMVRLLGGKLKSRLAALAGVHLEQHRHDLEGLERFQDRFSKEHQNELASKKVNPILDVLKTGRAVALPTILMPVVGGAALAFGQDSFSPLALALTLVGSAFALLAANLLNDLYDFRGGADQSARGVPGAIETGSGAFVEGRWSIRKGWMVVLTLAALALACGAVLAWLTTPMVLAYAAAGAVISYIYVGPPLALAYKGRGLGELAIFFAFGPIAVAGAVLAHGGVVTDQVWWVGGLFGLSSVLMLYHHHFLHWQADRAARKWSPVALVGPRGGSILGLALAALTMVAILVAWGLGMVRNGSLVAVLPPLLLVAPHLRVLRGDLSTPAMVGVAKGAFGAMALTGLALAITLWI